MWQWWCVSINLFCNYNKHTFFPFLGKGPGWIIDSVVDQTIIISTYNPLAGGS